MMLDSDQGRMWTAHGKALGDELAAAARALRHPSPAIERAAQVLLATVAGLVSLGIAVLPGLLLPGAPLLA
ncbi:hypothetical protein [Sandarakinorhabdus sp. DWP1-3-1]|uniref:hypothetical protein n=1 Tax=Sandarakinorhabdus sp. DWP1-3-1 TaxID=2804627 RepID=UPI003CE6C323